MPWTTAVFTVPPSSFRIVLLPSTIEFDWRKYDVGVYARTRVRILLCSLSSGAAVAEGISLMGGVCFASHKDEERTTRSF